MKWLVHTLSRPDRQRAWVVDADSAVGAMAKIKAARLANRGRTHHRRISAVRYEVADARLVSLASAECAHVDAVKKPRGFAALSVEERQRMSAIGRAAAARTRAETAKPHSKQPPPPDGYVTMTAAAGMIGSTKQYVHLIRERLGWQRHGSRIVVAVEGVERYLRIRARARDDG